MTMKVVRDVLDRFSGFIGMMVNCNKSAMVYSRFA